MDKETANYIIQYFSSLLTDQERQAIRHGTITAKLANNTSFNKTAQEKGWLSTDQAVLDLLKNGYDHFKYTAATRILKEHSEKVFLNTCEKCGKLARTPQARQCRYCKHDWHYLVVAHFQCSLAFQFTGRPFFLQGKIIDGEINPGNFIDLRLIGLNCKPTITAIEHVRIRLKSGSIQEIALFINDLDERQKQLLKAKSYHESIVVDILVYNNRKIML